MRVEMRQVQIGAEPSHFISYRIEACLVSAHKSAVVGSLLGSNLFASALTRWPNLTIVFPSKFSWFRLLNLPNCELTAVDCVDRIQARTAARNSSPGRHWNGAVEGPL